ncbi:hypothetical protein CDIK_1344 [Cucumispora dikerogammari]|nr:hypothetical protein CDIK_1344 [Cucumispora dikerogammari]
MPANMPLTIFNLFGSLIISAPEKHLSQQLITILPPVLKTGDASESVKSFNGDNIPRNFHYIEIIVRCVDKQTKKNIGKTDLNVFENFSTDVCPIYFDHNENPYFIDKEFFPLKIDEKKYDIHFYENGSGINIETDFLLSIRLSKEGSKQLLEYCGSKYKNNFAVRFSLTIEVSDSDTSVTKQKVLLQTDPVKITGFNPYQFETIMNINSSKTNTPLTADTHLSDFKNTRTALLEPDVESRKTNYKLWFYLVLGALIIVLIVVIVVFVVVKVNRKRVTSLRE